MRLQACRLPLLAMSADIPLPPFDLSARLVHGSDIDAARTEYLKQGRYSREAIERVIPQGWTWEGKRVLDFGCGAGRAIRHFLDLAPQTELWGTDIDARCIEWNREHFGHGATFAVNGEVPPTELPTGYFDLVYALSVFTHLSTHWAGWLLELYRVLAPGGILVATIMSEGMTEQVSGESWDERSFGMAVYEEGQDWEHGGPMVLHSPWWIEEHWGRLFEIERLMASGFHANEASQDDQGVVVMRKTDRRTDHAGLLRLDPSEGREATALYHDVQHLRAEIADLRRKLDS
jgi:SAM-dependent methyltransferase